MKAPIRLAAAMVSMGSRAHAEFFFREAGRPRVYRAALLESARICAG